MSAIGVISALTAALTISATADYTAGNYVSQSRSARPRHGTYDRVMLARIARNRVAAKAARHARRVRRMRGGR